MAVTITRTPWIDDDGTGTTGTVINNAVKTALYNDIDGALAKLIPATGPGSGLIAFPAVQVPSADPNTLDDYEEGTWVPLLGGSAGQSGQSYATQFGSYLKIGQLVVAAFSMTLTAKGTITGNMVLKGLPFLPTPNSVSVATVAFHLLATPWVSIVLTIANNATDVFFTGMPVAGVSNLATLLTPADISNATILQATVVYRAAQ